MSVIESLAKVVGTERVVTDKNVLKGFAGDLSFVAGETPLCVVKPRNVEDVLKIVAVANEQKCPLIPFSSGGPRFNGDTVPAVANAVMVDLSGMRSIVRIDKRQKMALIEAGVTFGELQAAAAKEGLRVAMPLAPKKEKSVVASLLEREPITIPKYHWDAEDPLCCIELVFGSGDLFRTGAAAGPGTLEEQWKAKQAQKVAMGPAQIGFNKSVCGAQGTMGITTWGSVKLEILPTIEKAFCVGSENLSSLIDFTYKLLRPKYTDLCFIMSGAGLASFYGKPVKNMPSWVLVYSLSGYRDFPEERVDYLEKDIADIGAEFGIKPEQSVAGVPAIEIVKKASVPSGEKYWKLASRGGCQEILFLASLSKAPELMEVMDAEVKKSGLKKEDIGVYLQPIRQGTGCHFAVMIQYDPNNADETKKVKALFDNLSKALADKGAFFSRPYGSWAEIAYGKCPDTVSALRKVKNLFDPQGIMNPGKLCFGREV